jgi:Ycf66 protein N-terminus
MLAHILAVLVGTGSVGLYIAAFFFPEIHRKNDFIWSGVGLFYALALWIYARQTTGGILVGQTASVALLGWFVWQTMQLRRQLVPIDRQTPIPTTTQIQQQLGLQSTGAKLAKPAKTPTNSKPSATKPTIVNPATPTPTTAPTGSTQVVDAAAQPGERVAPSKVIPTAVPVTPTSSPVQVPPAVQTAPPTEPRAKVATPAVREPQMQPTAASPTMPENDAAWIALEIKPSPTAPKPLGQPVKPPITPTEPPQLPAITAESVARNLPPTVPTTVQLDDVDI